MIIVFDLDDTLFDELTFVRGGFCHVAAFLSTITQTSSKQLLKEMEDALKEGRSNIFDRVLAKHGIKNKRLIAQCVSLYRSHQPKIKLNKEAISCLKRFKDYPLYVVTDGNRIVQKRKFDSLGLDKWVRHCFCTYAHGRHRSKPSSYCFEKICQRERALPQQVVYVGDNPHKDFVGLKPLAFHTIRLLKGPYAKVKVDRAHDADVSIHSLDELDEALIKRLYKNVRQKHNDVLV